MFQAIGALGPYILAVATVVYLYIQSYITYLQIFTVGFVINLFINFAVKLAIKQPRPKGDETDDKKYEFGTATGKRQGADRYGMPSGHAQTIGYILAFMSPIFTSTRDSVFPYIYWFAGYIAVATTTVFQRIAYHHHTALQVAVGLAIGVVVGILTHRFAKRRIKEKTMTKN